MGEIREIRRAKKSFIRHRATAHIFKKSFSTLCLEVIRPGVEPSHCSGTMGNEWVGDEWKIWWK